jgi:hypothetical protein
MEHVVISISAPRENFPMYEGVGNVFYKRLERYLSGVGHPQGVVSMIDGLEAPSAEERAVSGPELRCYYLLKAVADCRTLPAQPDFEITVRHCYPEGT